MTDRVELTGPEKREFERQYRHALRDRIELEGLTFPPTPQLLRSVESIVAARVQAPTAERDGAQRRADEGWRLAREREGQRDAARARCAELEAKWAASDQRAERNGAAADALQATLDRVVALADEWEASAARTQTEIDTWATDYEKPLFAEHRDSLLRRVADLRAALTPEGTE